MGIVLAADLQNFTKILYQVTSVRKQCSQVRRGPGESENRDLEESISSQKDDVPLDQHKTRLILSSRGQTRSKNCQVIKEKGEGWARLRDGQWLKHLCSSWGSEFGSQHQHQDCVTPAPRDVSSSSGLWHIPTAYTHTDTYIDERTERKKNDKSGYFSLHTNKNNQVDNTSLQNC